VDEDAPRPGRKAQPKASAHSAAMRQLQDLQKRTKGSSFLSRPDINVHKH